VAVAALATPPMLLEAWMTIVTLIVDGTEALKHESGHLSRICRVESHDKLHRVERIVSD
jgi:hypothetical protein